MGPPVTTPVLVLEGYSGGSLLLDESPSNLGPVRTGDSVDLRSWVAGPEVRQSVVVVEGKGRSVSVWTDVGLATLRTRRALEGSTCVLCQCTSTRR